MDETELKERTKKTAQLLFHSLQGGVGYETWKKFDRGLARALSVCFTGHPSPARPGAGAFLKGARLAVSDVAALADAFLVHAGLAILRKAGRWDGFVRLVDATDRHRGLGGSWGYGLLAEGRVD